MNQSYIAWIVSAVLIVLGCVITYRLSKLMNQEIETIRQANMWKKEIECKVTDLDKSKVDWAAFHESIKRLHDKMEAVLVNVAFLVAKDRGKPSDMGL